MPIILPLLVVFGAVVCLVMGLTWKQESPLASRIAMLRGERTAVDLSGVMKVDPMGQRLLAPMINGIVGQIEKFLPTRWLQGIDTALVSAGQPTTRTGFLIGVVLAEALMVFFAFMLSTAGHIKGVQAIGLFFGCALMGILLPKMWLGSRVRARQSTVLKSLPDAFDLITVCVEAGLGLDAALARVAEKTEGPFGEELAIMLREVSMGKLRRDALRELAVRVNVPDLNTFINAVVQAETMGTSIATVLRVQAEQMRIKRRQRAEQQAHQAPIKMMFPLVFCIFPTLFIVILGPAGITMYQTLIAK